MSTDHQRGRVTYTEQEMLNLMTDPDVTSTPLGIRGGLGWVDEAPGKAAWIKQPYMGKPPRVEMEWNANKTLKYEGWNDTYNADENSDDWIITYYIWDADMLFLRSQTMVGSWALRGSIAWTIS